MAIIVVSHLGFSQRSGRCVFFDYQDRVVSTWVAPELSAWQSSRKILRPSKGSPLFAASRPVQARHGRALPRAISGRGVTPALPTGWDAEEPGPTKRPGAVAAIVRSSPQTRLRMESRRSLLPQAFCPQTQKSRIAVVGRTPGQKTVARVIPSHAAPWVPDLPANCQSPLEPGSRIPGHGGFPRGVSRRNMSSQAAKVSMTTSSSSNFSANGSAGGGVLTFSGVGTMVGAGSLAGAISSAE